MTGSDTAAVIMALVANVVGAVVVLLLWGRSRRRVTSIMRHPTVRPPISVDVVPAPPWARLAVAVPPSAPPVAIDIVSYRLAHPPGPWENEPLDSPTIVQPGASAVLTARLAPDAHVDVVVAWTARHPTGHVEGSRVFHLPADRDDAPVAAGRTGVLTGRWALLAVALLAAAAALVTRSAVLGLFLRT